MMTFDPTPYQTPGFVLVMILASIFLVSVPIGMVFSHYTYGDGLSRRVIALLTSLVVLGIGMFAWAISLSPRESANQAAQKYFGLSGYENQYILPKRGEVSTTLKNVPAKPEGENDYALYDFVVITKNADGTYTADYVNKK